MKFSHGGQSAAAAIFLGTLKIHSEFYEIEFYNSI